MSRLDLAPAKWIWFPSQRTLANTFVLFRREVMCDHAPTVAKGRIAADSRYRLTVNGERVQWGPAPHDPRYAEADPVDLTPYLKAGLNVIGVEVLFYGHGEGTWPFGKPGLLLKLDIDGQSVVSDASWHCTVDRAHRPGQFRRWYLRALQEEFDARRHPQGWDRAGFDATGWVPAQESQNPPDRAAFASGYGDYANEVWMSAPAESTLSERSIPLLREELIPAMRLVDTGVVDWKRDPDDWFEFRSPGSFEVTSVTKPSGTHGPDSVVLPKTDPAQGHFATFEFEEEIVGWPRFTIDAPEGTVVELMVQESHDAEKHPWLDSHYFQWSRFVCREGVNYFEAFDYEAFRWLQVHVHGHSRPVTVSKVGVRRRVFPWPNQPQIRVDDPKLQRLFEATVNTLNNCAQDIVVDGMGRERQQYSGDCGHQLHVVRYAFGENRLPARFLRTFGQGQFLDGVFSDSWPAADRLNRIWERNVDASGWGPLVDHSVGFCFDHYHHWMQSGDLSPAKDNWPRLMRFVDYLESILGDDGLLKVEDIGVNTVWIDHDAYQQQRHKQCAFNLYALAALREALLPMAEELDAAQVSRLREFADVLQRKATDTFWDASRKTFVNNRPFNEATVRIDDRALATAILYDLCPHGDTDASVELLANPTDEVGKSYPANLPWNYWALAKAGRMQAVIDDLRSRWTGMRSAVENNSLQEHWHVTPDTTNLMSHCPIAPLIALYQGVMGLVPTKPGFSELALRPQLGNLGSVELTAFIPLGAVRLKAVPTPEGHRLRIQTPESASGTLQLGERTQLLAAGVDVEVDL
jgi:hypothetical protein